MFQHVAGMAMVRPLEDSCKEKKSRKSSNKEVHAFNMGDMSEGHCGSQAYVFKGYLL